MEGDRTSVEIATPVTGDATREPSSSVGYYLGTRLFWGIALGALIVGLLAYADFWVMVAAVIAANIGLREFFHLTRCDKPKTFFPLRRLGYIFCTVLLVLTWLGYPALEPLLVLFIISTFVYQMGRFSMEKANFLYELAITLLGSIYIGGLLSFALKLKILQHAYPTLGHGFDFLPLVPLVGAWAYDTSAFFSGVLFGRIKLIPSVSPKKSVEGAIGGVVGAGTAMSILGYAAGVSPDVIPLSYLFSLGVLLGVLSQVGDLCVSALKREMAAKDSSLLIPGHGGLLDKIDGLLFTLPAAYYLLSLYLEFHPPA